MPFIPKEGCCGSSLQRTCLVIGIVFLVIDLIATLIDFIAFLQTSTFTFGIPDVLFIIISICLILAAKLENKYLCIPWFIGFAMTIIMAIIIPVLFYSAFLNYLYDEDVNVTEATFVFLLTTPSIIIVVVHCSLIRYVIAYYEELSN